MMFFKTPTADKLRREALRTAEIDLIAHHSQLDYYQSSTEMLRKRIQRLRSEVASPALATQKAPAQSDKFL